MFVCFIAMLIAVVGMLQAHATVGKVVRRGAKAIASMAAGGGRDRIEELVAQGARAVQEAIAADPDLSAKAHTAVREALEKLS